MKRFLYFLASIKQMKKWLIGVGVVFLLVIAGYVYFTATRAIEVQEASPLQGNDGIVNHNLA